VRVDDVGLLELDRRAGELAEHERAPLVVPAGDVLLGDEVHPVAQGGDEQDVRREVERDEFLLGERLMQVVHRRVPQLGVLAVDPSDVGLNLFAQRLVALDALPARRGDLHEDRSRELEALFVEELLDRLQPVQDPLGVVEPVDAEQDELGVAELAADGACPLPHLRTPGDLGDAPGVHGDREGLGADEPLAYGPLRPDVTATRRQARPAAGAQEVVRVGRPLESDEVGAEQPVEDLTAPGELREQLVGRERDVVEEADPQVRSNVAEQLRHQLELVVLHPDGRAGGCLGGGDVREPPVDVHVAVPPAAVVDRRGDDVVVERPQRAVRHALVVVRDLPAGQRDGDEVHVGGVERRRRLPLGPGPPDPRATVLPEHRLQRGDEPSRAGQPGDAAVGFVTPVDGQPVGHDDEVEPLGHQPDPRSSTSSHRRVSPMDACSDPCIGGGGFGTLMRP
jgi:hypothetical protein